MELVANFDLNTNNLETDFDISTGENFDIIFEINANGTIWGNISGNIENQTDLKDALDNLENNISTNTADITSIETTMNDYGDIVTYNASDFATSAQGTLADTALQPNDNISDLNNDAGYITSSALEGYATETELTNGLAEKQDTISDLSTIRSNAENGQSAYTTIQGYGNIVTYNASAFATASQGQLADSSLQPNDNISELVNDAGYITSESLPTVNNAKITIQKNGVDVENFTLNQSNNETINITVPTQASDINAVPTSRTVNGKALSANISLNSMDVGALSSTTTINDLTTTAQQNALNSGATTTNIGQITTNANDISDIQDLIPSQATSSNQLADKNFVNSSISTNTANFIGTFNSVADLEAYSGTLTNNDYAFVETTDSAGNTLYDRYKYTTATTPAGWQFEYELNNSSFTANQWEAINSGATTTNIGQISTNANDISDINTTIGGYGDIVTHDVSEFATAAQGNKADTALQSGDNITELVNNAGYITGITSSDVTTALGYTPYSNANPNSYQENVIESIEVNGTAQTISSKTVDITVPTDTSDLTNNAGFITGINSTDVTTALGYTPYNSSNPNGYTSNVGTVTSVNNTQPVNGNVTISIPDTSYLANKDLSNLSSTGETYFLKNIAGGTNSLSILAYGNVNGNNATSIGVNSRALGNGSISLGTDASNYAENSIAIGYQATVASLCSSAIQLGYGTNSTAKSLSIGFYDYSTPTNYQLLDGTTGLIPDARINKQTSITSSSTDDQIPSAKCVYDNVKNTVNQETADTIPLYAWYNSTFGIAYTLSANPAVSDAIYRSYPDLYLGRISTIDSSTSIRIIVVGSTTAEQSFTRDSSNDTTATRSTLTDYSGNNLNITQADGQWVASYSSHSWTSKGSYTITLSDYLPSDSANYAYYIYVVAGASRESSNGTFRVGTIASPVDNADTAGNYSIGGYMNSSYTQHYSSAIIPVAAGGNLYAQLTVALNNSYCHLHGYRRIGTNS